MKITSNCDVTSCIADNVETHLKSLKYVINRKCNFFDVEFIALVRLFVNFLFIKYQNSIFNVNSLNINYISIFFSLSIKTLSGLFLNFQSTSYYTRRILWYFQTYIWFGALSVWNSLQKHNLCWWKYAVLQVMVSIGYTFTSTTVMCLKYCHYGEKTQSIN